MKTRAKINLKELEEVETLLLFQEFIENVNTGKISKEELLEISKDLDYFNK